MKFKLEKKRKKIIPASRFRVAIAPWRLQIIVGLSIFFTIALLVIGTWYGTRISAFQIVTVTVVGGSTISHELIERTTNGALIGSHFRLIPYTFTWLYPEERILGQLKNIPRVKNVHVEADGQTLAIAFEEYQPFALWCESFESETCFFLDTEGFAFAKAPELIGSAFVRYIEMGSLPSAKIQAFPSAYIESTSALAERLESELHLYVTHIIRRDDIDTSLILAGGAEIKLSDRMTANDTFANLETIFASKDFTNIATGDFHYIDLRFGDKVFVSEVEMAATSTATTTVTDDTSVME